MTERKRTELVCVECGVTSTDGVGWRALLTAEDEEAEDNDGANIYCPQCAAREFGEP